MQPSNADAGFVSDAIGVGRRARATVSRAAGSTPQTQTLGLKLGAGLAGKVIDYAEIDLEGKFGATVRVDGYFVTGACPRLR